MSSCTCVERRDDLLRRTQSEGMTITKSLDSVTGYGYFLQLIAIFVHCYQLNEISVPCYTVKTFCFKRLYPHFAYALNPEVSVIIFWKLSVEYRPRNVISFWDGNPFSNLPAFQYGSSSLTCILKRFFVIVLLITVLFDAVPILIYFLAFRPSVRPSVRHSLSCRSHWTYGHIYCIYFC